MDQLAKCRACGSYQPITAKFCAECAAPIAGAPIALRQEIVPPTAQHVRVVKAGRGWRAGGFVAVAIGTVLVVAGASGVGGTLAVGGFIAFVVGRLME